eukprot:14019-Amphidinium_carterae.3
MLRLEGTTGNPGNNDSVACAVQPGLVEKTWARIDKASSDLLHPTWTKGGGPRWEKVWKRDTYNFDDGKLIAEELKSRKELVEFVIPSEPPPDKKVKLKVHADHSSTGHVASEEEKRQKGIESINKELASFKNNEVISPELREKCRQAGNYPLPTQMVFVEKPDMEQR